MDYPESEEMTSSQAQIACCVESYILKKWKHGERVGESNLNAHHNEIYANYPHANFARIQILENGIGEDGIRDVESALLIGCQWAWNRINEEEA
tara:strand:- start:2139 stop:2420 length:282 start_codon:yes stop_codon:yes gene_type:complete